MNNIINLYDVRAQTADSLITGQAISQKNIIVVQSLISIISTKSAAVPAKNSYLIRSEFLRDQRCGMIWFRTNAFMVEIAKRKIDYPSTTLTSIIWWDRSENIRLYDNIRRSWSDWLTNIFFDHISAKTLFPAHYYPRADRSNEISC